ncbi:family 1 extracellular solute-binding protein [Nostoc sp. NIES-4103]|nr:family 1 extracellular solute-binding protein [Nostoc sp. NIES-4103]
MKTWQQFKILGFRIWAILLVLITSITVIRYYSLSPQSKTVLVSKIITSLSVYPKTFNPALDEYPSLVGYTHEGLVSENNQGVIQPSLAESWQISEDKKEIIFTLRSGLKWSDGQPITADDVVFTYRDIFLNKTIPTNGQDLLRIGKNRAFPSIEKIGDLQVKFTLPEAYVPFIRATKLPILPAHVLRQVVNIKDENGKSLFLSTWANDTPSKKMVANGPYKIEGFVPGERIFFRKNPYYWRKDQQGNSLPYIDRIIWQTIDSTDNAIIQFRAQGLDYIGLDPSYFSLLKREEKKGDFTIYNGGASLYVSHISFNLNQGSRNGKPLVDPIKSGWFNNLAFRQAIAFGIDRQSLLNNVYAGLGEIATSYLPIQSPYYLSPQAGLKYYEYNPVKAKELLIKAGFKYNSQGRLLDKQGNLVRFTLTTIASEKILESIAVHIQQDLNRIGIQVDVNPVALGLFIDKLTNSLDWDCHVVPLKYPVEPNEMASVFLPEGGFHVYNQQPQRGQQPITGRKVADWERKIGNLYVQGATEFDEVKRQAIYAEAQRLALEYLPFIYLVKPLELAAMRNRIQGFKYSASSEPFWNIYELKVVK